MNFYERFVALAISLSGKSSSINTESFPLEEEACTAQELERCRKYIKDSSFSDQEKGAFSVVLEHYAARASKTNLEFPWDKQKIEARLHEIARVRAADFPIIALDNLDENEQSFTDSFFDEIQELNKGHRIKDVKQLKELQVIYINSVSEEEKGRARELTASVIASVILDQDIVDVFFEGIKEISANPKDVEILWGKYINQFSSESQENVRRINFKDFTPVDVQTGGHLDLLSKPAPKNISAAEILEKFYKETAREIQALAVDYLVEYSEEYLSGVKKLFESFCNNNSIELTMENQKKIVNDCLGSLPATLSPGYNQYDLTMAGIQVQLFLYENAREYSEDDDNNYNNTRVLESPGTLQISDGRLLLYAMPHHNTVENIFLKIYKKTPASVDRDIISKEITSLCDTPAIEFDNYQFSNVLCECVLQIQAELIKFYNSNSGFTPTTKTVESIASMIMHSLMQKVDYPVESEDGRKLFVYTSKVLTGITNKIKLKDGLQAKSIIQDFCKAMLRNISLLVRQPAMELDIPYGGFFSAGDQNTPKKAFETAFNEGDTFSSTMKRSPITGDNVDVSGELYNIPGTCFEISTEMNDEDLLAHFFDLNKAYFNEDAIRKSSDVLMAVSLESLWDAFINDERLGGNLKQRVAVLEININGFVKAAKNKVFLGDLKKVFSIKSRRNANLEQEDFANKIEAVAILSMLPDISKLLILNDQQREDFQKICNEPDGIARLRLSIEWVTKAKVVRPLLDYFRDNKEDFRKETDASGRKDIIRILIPAFLHQVDNSRDVSRLLSNGIFGLDDICVSEKLITFCEEARARFNKCTNVESEMLSVVKDMAHILIKDFQDIFPDTETFEADGRRIFLEGPKGSDSKNANKLIADLMPSFVSILRNRFARNASVNDAILDIVFEDVVKFFGSVPDEILNESNFYLALSDYVQVESGTRIDAGKMRAEKLFSTIELKINALFSAKQRAEAAGKSLPLKEELLRILDEVLALYGRVDDYVFSRALVTIWKEIVGDSTLSSAISAVSESVKKIQLSVEALPIILPVIQNAAAFSLYEAVDKNSNAKLNALVDELVGVLSNTFIQKNSANLQEEKVSNESRIITVLLEQVNKLSTRTGIGEVNSKYAIKKILESSLDLHQKLLFIGAIGQAKVENLDALSRISSGIVGKRSGETQKFYEGLKEFNGVELGEIDGKFKEFEKTVGINQQREAPRDQISHQTAANLPAQAGAASHGRSTSSEVTTNSADGENVGEKNYEERFLSSLQNPDDGLPPFPAQNGSDKKDLSDIEIQRFILIRECLKPIKAEEMKSKTAKILYARWVGEKLNSLSQSKLDPLDYIALFKEGLLDSYKDELQAAIADPVVGGDVSGNKENFSTLFTYWINFAAKTGVVPLKEDLALIGVFPTAEEVKVCYQKIQDKFTGPGKRKSALLEALQDVCIKRKIDYWTVIDPLSSTANYQEMTLSALLKVYENKDSSDYEKSSAAKAIKDQCGKDGAALKNLADAFNGFKVVRSMMNLFSAHVYPSGMSQIVVMINEERSAADVLLALKNLAATKNKDIYKAFSGLVPRYSETQKAYDDINKFFNQGAQGQVLLTEDSGLMESEDETHGSSNQHRTMEDLIDKIKEAQSNTINTPAKTHV